MSLLVADLQTVLSRICGAVFTVSGLDGSATSPYYLDGIAASLRELGVVLSNPITVIDLDLLGVTQDQVSQLLDVAELRSLETARTNYVQVDIKFGLEETYGSSIARTLEAAIVRKAAYCRMKYGVGLGSLSFDTISLNFQQPDSDDAFGPADLADDTMPWGP